jgi:hypothetical protein
MDLFAVMRQAEGDSAARNCMPTLLVCCALFVASSLAVRRLQYSGRRNPAQALS